MGHPRSFEEIEHADDIADEFEQYEPSSEGLVEGARVDEREG